VSTFQGLEGGDDGGFVGHVQRQAHVAGAQRRRHACRVVAVDVQHRHAPAACGQQRTHAGTDAAATAGDRHQGQGT
jgi:hypothetical protein